MPIKNDTLLNKLLSKKAHLESKILPMEEELFLTNTMIASLNEHKKKQTVEAEKKLGIEQFSEEA